MKHTILIMEDDESMRFLLEYLLKKEYHLVFKYDGLSGMKYLVEGNMPTLILCDFVLPKMNGYDFLNSLSQSGMFSDIPVVMVSSRRDDKFKEQCLKAGARGFLGKPFDPVMLQSLLNKIITNKVEN